MAFVQPEKAADAFDLVPGMMVADFGCGSGHWVIPLAERIGTAGKVFAFDVLPAAIEATRSKAKFANLYNVETVWTDLEAPQATKLKEGILDFVLLSNILSQTEHKDTVAAECWRILKNSGKAAVIDWDTMDKKTNHPVQKLLTRQDAEYIMKKAGFIFEKEFSAGSYHYGLMFRKQG